GGRGRRQTGSKGGVLGREKLTSKSLAHSTRLHLRFAVVTAAVIATAGLALFWYVQREEVRQAERNITSRAMYAEKSILRDELRPADVAQPVAGARLKRLDDLFVNRVLVDGG